MAKFPYMTEREGSPNLYYKRAVPRALHAPGRARQIWKSLGTGDEDAAKPAYRQIDIETDALFEQWRIELEGPAIVAPAPVETKPLTAALSKSIVARWQNERTEHDFKDRGDRWATAQADRAAFWESLDSPAFDQHREGGDLKGAFLLALCWQRQRELEALKEAYRLGVVGPVEARLADMLKADGVDLAPASFAMLCRRVLAGEIEIRERLLSEDHAALGLKEAEQEPAPAQPATKSKPMPLMSDMVREYIRETLREKSWTRKDELRWRAMLDEFSEIAGNRPANRYEHNDGAEFKSLQLRLPAIRAGAEYKGKTSKQCAAIFEKKLATASPEERKKLKHLSASTIKDKIGCVFRFFEWVRTRDRSVVNPLEGIKIERSRRRKTKPRIPWSIDELNHMFAAPIYTGARSAHFWQQPGDTVLKDTAMYWAPLIALFSGMRLGEIIQLHVADIKTADSITYFDVTPDGSADDDENAKSVKTLTSQRQIGVHQILTDLGFLDFVERQRMAGLARLFPDYEKSRDDELWSKAFTKHFKRFRDSLTVKNSKGEVIWKVRDGVDFHSLRHNVEDVLRNARDVKKEVRDAVQGHGESGVGGGYGDGMYVETLNEAVQKISYPGLMLDHLKR